MNLLYFACGFFVLGIACVVWHISTQPESATKSELVKTQNRLTDSEFRLSKFDDELFNQSQRIQVVENVQQERQERPVLPIKQKPRAMPLPSNEKTLEPHIQALIDAEKEQIRKDSISYEESKQPHLRQGE